MRHIANRAILCKWRYIANGDYIANGAILQMTLYANDYIANVAIL
jgi:hypothetical protein